MLTGVVPSQDMQCLSPLAQAGEIEFLDGSSACLNRLYRWMLMSSGRKSIVFILLERGSQNNPDVHDFLICRWWAADLVQVSNSFPCREHDTGQAVRPSGGGTGHPAGRPPEEDHPRRR